MCCLQWQEKSEKNTVCSEIFILTQRNPFASVPTHTEDFMSKQITKLKTLRESKFLTMTELANLAGVTAQTISTAEMGNRISLGSIKKIAGALRVAPEKLL